MNKSTSLYAKKVIFLRGRKYGVLRTETVVHWCAGSPRVNKTTRTVATIQRVDKHGAYIAHSPIRVYLRERRKKKGARNAATMPRV